MRRRSILLMSLLLLLASAGGALAVRPDEVLADPVLEGRARALSRELRCMVCQNQSIDDSDAPLAHDLRVLVRERLKAGDTDRQVIDFLVARYGEFVLLRPRFEAHTLLLWGLPPAALVGGMAVLFVLARKRRKLAGEPPLSADEQRRVSGLVGPSHD